MKTINGQELKEMLIELYSYYFSEVNKTLIGEERKRDYQTGIFSGGLDAVSAIFLQLYGGRELMKLWTSHLLKDSEGGTDDQTTGD